jgi:hypothetical protein
VKAHQLRDWLSLLPDVVRDTAGDGWDALADSNPFEPGTDAHAHWERSIQRFLFISAASVASRLITLIADKDGVTPRFAPQDGRGRIRRYFSTGEKANGDLLFGWLATQGFVEIWDDPIFRNVQVKFLTNHLPSRDEVFASMVAEIDRHFFSEPRQPELELTEPATVNQPEIALG